MSGTILAEDQRGSAVFKMRGLDLCGADEGDKRGTSYNVDDANEVGMMEKSEARNHDIILFGKLPQHQQVGGFSEYGGICWHLKM